LLTTKFMFNDVLGRLAVLGKRFSIIRLNKQYINKVTTIKKM